MVQVVHETSAGWVLANNAEWVLALASPTPLPPGTSSQLVEDYSVGEGHVRFRGEVWGHTLQILATLQDPDTALISDRLSYGQATDALQEFLRPGATGGNRPAFDVVHVPKQVEGGSLEARLRDLIAPRVTAPDIDGLNPSIVDKVQTHNSTVQRAFLQHLASLGDADMKRFAEAILPSLGLGKARFVTASEDVVMVKALAYRSRGIERVSTWVYVIRPSSAAVASTVRRLATSHADDHTLILTTDVLDKSDALKLAGNAEVLGGHDLYNLCAENGLAGLTRIASAYGFRPE